MDIDTAQSQLHSTRNSNVQYDRAGYAHDTRPTCWHCGKRGHYVKNCHFRYADSNNTRGKGGNYHCGRRSRSNRGCFNGSRGRFNNMETNDSINNADTEITTRAHE